MKHSSLISAPGTERPLLLPRRLGNEQRDKNSRGRGWQPARDSVFPLFFCLKNKSYVLAGYGGGRWRDRGEGAAGTEAGRMGEEEGAGKVGRVALNNVALHAAFRVCARACFVWMKQTARRLARSSFSLLSFFLIAAFRSEKAGM